MAMKKGIPTCFKDKEGKVIKIGDTILSDFGVRRFIDRYGHAVEVTQAGRGNFCELKELDFSQWTVESSWFPEEESATSENNTPQDPKTEEPKKPESVPARAEVKTVRLLPQRTVDVLKGASDDQIFAELKRRGFSGSLTWTRTISI